MRSWLSWPWRLAVFGAWFAREIVVANLAVLRDNLTAGQNCTPGIASFATSCRTDAEITTLAALITLTPGTLALGTEIGDDTHRTRTLYVHAMYSADADTLRRQLHDLETRLLGALRRRGEA